MRDRYHSLLQIGGCCAIVAFHAHAPGFRTGWAAVELFFALSGYHMARAFDGELPLGAFARRRYARLIPGILVVLPALLALAWVRPSRSLLLFLCTSPLLAHNLARLAMAGRSVGGMLWIPLWFLGALFQLQLLVYILRRPLRALPAHYVLLGVCGAAFLFRLAVAAGLGLHDGSLPPDAADALYWLPLTHLEPFVLGLLLGQQRLRGWGRWLPLWATLTLVAGLLNVVLLGSPAESFGYPLDMADHFQFLWGYLLLAVLAAGLVDPHSSLAGWVTQWRLSPRVDAALARLSEWSFLAYVVHGGVLLALEALVRQPDTAASFSPLGAIGKTLLAILLAFALAAALTTAGHSIFRRM